MVFLYLGFPPVWEENIALCTGLIVILISLRIHVHNKPAQTEHTKEHIGSYVENGDTHSQ